MADDDFDRATQRRYATLIRAAFPTNIQIPAATDDGRVFRVESGSLLPYLMAGGAARLPVPPSVPLQFVARVTDASGHDRPHYRGLLCYCWARALTSPAISATDPSKAAWEAHVAASCRSLDAVSVVQVDALHARDGALIAAQAWNALAIIAAERLDLSVAGSSDAGTFFATLAARQDESGSFFRATSSDNPETHWYHELVLLHAAASFAALTGDALVASAVRRHTEWVQAETQPDHATGEPWGLHAFISNPQTLPLADQLLHTVRTLHPAGATGVSLMLLADALYCLGPPEGFGQTVDSLASEGKVDAR